MAGTVLLDKRFENAGLAFSFHSTGAPLAGLFVPVGASLVAASYIGGPASWSVLRPPLVRSRSLAWPSD